MEPGTLMSRLLFGAAILMAVLASFEAFLVIVKMSRPLEGIMFQ